jgi:hypothetical protein
MGKELFGLSTISIQFKKSHVEKGRTRFYSFLLLCSKEKIKKGPSEASRALRSLPSAPATLVSLRRMALF